VRKEEWTLFCRQVKAAEEEYTNRENEIGNIMKRIIIKPNDDETGVIKHWFWLESFDTNFMKEFYWS
jgi:hypothetical protein